jgi:fucose permease
MFWSLGALAAPAAVGALVGTGVPWQAILAVSGVTWLGIAVPYAVVAMPSGRVEQAVGSGAWSPSRLSVSIPLLAAAAAIAAYVAAEYGVSSWLVAFLRDAPVSVATLGLSLFWAGLTGSRFVVSRFGDRFDPVRLVVVALVAAGAAIAVAVFAGEVVVSIALFAVAGFAFGPIFPTIVIIGGRLYPGRAAAVSGALSAASDVGAIAYPPLMGLISVSAGLRPAMLGTAFLAAACAVLVVVAGRGAQRSSLVAASGGQK